MKTDIDFSPNFDPVTVTMSGGPMDGYETTEIPGVFTLKFPRICSDGKIRDEIYSAIDQRKVYKYQGLSD